MGMKVQFFVYMVLYDVQFEKLKSKHFSQDNNISANQMISGDSKGVNYRHVWFNSITS